MDPLIRIRDAQVVHQTDGGPVHALDGVDLDVAGGERLAIVGESGAGKSTLVRVALGLERLRGGSAHLDGLDVGDPGARRRAWRSAQLLHQDPDAHLGVGLTAGALLRESARIHRPGEPPGALTEAALAQVGLAGRGDADPRVLSGGERRRLGIARVLLARPAVLLADEPTTGLDGPRAWQVAQLLRRGADAPPTLVLVTHDLRLAAALADRIVVMLGGRIVEDRPASSLRDAPHHPHTAALVAAAGLLEGRPRLPGAPAPGPGCTLRRACPLASPECEARVPLRRLSPAHALACPHVP